MIHREYARTHEGRHRDDSIAADIRCTRRDYCAQAFGQWYKPRHSADFRAVQS